MTEDQEIEFIIEEDQNDLNMYSSISNNICIEYFVGYEIAALLGYKNPSKTINDNVSKCNQLEFRYYPGVKEPKLDPKTILINSDGAIEILLKTRKRISPDVLHILKKFNIDTTNRKYLTKEQQTLSAIANAFKTEKIEDQYKVGTYYLDLYFSEYKIILECDENGHVDRKPCDERERMDFVNEKFEIDDTHWIRYNPDEHDFDISKVINKIYRKINCIKESKNNKNLIGITDISKIFEKDNPILDYEIDKYKVDLYFPNQKIIFEFYKNDTSRKNYINTILGEQKIINSDKIVEETKICSKCKETKNTTEDFGKRKKSSDGYKVYLLHMI